MRLTITIALAAALLLPAPASGADERPNIVVVMLDDLAEGAAGRLLERQPEIKALFLNGGQRWTNFYANDPLCCPGRASFLTGLYAHHHGVIRNDARLLDPSETIATALDRVGYHTALVGKYLNGAGSLDDKTPPGWDDVAMTGGGYYADWWMNGKLVAHSDRTDPSDYSTDVLANRAVRSIRRAPIDAPLFLYLNPFATHSDGNVYKGPLPAPRHARDARCDGVAPYRSPAYNEADVSDKPAWVQALSVEANPGPGWPMGEACRALLSVDEMVGRVEAAFTEVGRDDVLFLLVADNGMAWGDHRAPGKGNPYAVHMPMWISWPARLGETTVVVEAYAQMPDLAPTLAELARATLGPYPTGQERPDGVSLATTILAGERPERDALLEEHRESKSARGVPPPWWGLRTTDGAWHYVEYDSGERELYDLAADPWELDNRAGDPAYVETQDRLALRLAEMRTN